MFSLGQGVGSHVAHLVKNPPAMWETWVRSLGWEDPLEKGERPSTPVFWPREFFGLYSPWGPKDCEFILNLFFRPDFFEVLLVPVFSPKKKPAPALSLRERLPGTGVGLLASFSPGRGNVFPDILDNLATITPSFRAFCLINASFTWKETALVTHFISLIQSSATF